jgi:hypothetical protein
MTAFQLQERDGMTAATSTIRTPHVHAGALVNVYVSVSVSNCSGRGFSLWLLASEAFDVATG